MSTTLAGAPWRRWDGFDFLAFFFLDAAVNDRLLFDFPHNVRCLFIFSQRDKGGVPQVTVGRPLGKLNPHYLTSCKPDLAEDLKRLRNARNFADYDMARDFSTANAELAYKTAVLAAASVRRLTAIELDRMAQCIRYLPPYQPNGLQR